MKNDISKNTASTKPDFSAIIENCPCGFITRMEIENVTGGLLNPKSVANMDSDPEVEGIKGRFKVGRKVCYPVKYVIEFLESRAQIIDPV